MRRLLEEYLRVYSHEFPRFVWLVAVCFVIFWSTAIFRNYVDAAFLKRYGPEYIPWMLFINAFLTFAVMNVSDRLSTRTAESNLLAGLLAVVSVAALALYVMVGQGSSSAYPILYQVLGLLDSVLFVYLWNLAGDFFDSRQGKRIFPLITASQLLGASVGSFSTRPIGRLIGEDPILIVFATVFFVTAVYVFRTARILPPQTAEPQSLGAAHHHRDNNSEKPWARPQSLRQVPRLMAQYPIIRYLVVTGLIPNILLPIFFYQFSIIANERFVSEQALLSFLGWFRGVTTFGTLFVLLFSGRLYARTGLPNASLVQPLNFVALFSTLTGFFNITVAAYGQLSSILIQRAVAGPVNKILYGVVPPGLKTWSRYFIRGTVLKLGMFVGSVFMLILKPVLTPRELAYPAAILAVYWTAETLIFRKEYKRILKQVVFGRRAYFKPADQPQPLHLRRPLQEPQSPDVQGFGENDLLADASSPGALDCETALTLLRRTEPAMRALAAEYLGKHRDARGVPGLVSLLDDHDDDVRNAAIDALIRYPKFIVAFLEASLLQASTRGRQGILEVIRLSPHIAEFETTYLSQRAFTQAYGNLIVIQRLRMLHNSAGATMLSEYLEQTNEDILTLIFYGLSVDHSDMRLLYQALRSDDAAVAVELVESSIRSELVPYLMPLIEDIPLEEKIKRGRELLLLVRQDDLERLLTYLVFSQDPVVRTLVLMVIADLMPDPTFVPVVESSIADENPHVRQVAQYAWAKAMNQEAQMPSIIEMIDKVKSFPLFEGMGIRELHAIATIITQETFEPGDTVMQEGEDCLSVYLVLSGKVTIYRKDGDSGEHELVNATAGALLGLMSLFTNLPNEVTCIAAERTETLVIPKIQFVELMKIYSQIGLNLCRFMAVRFREFLFTRKASS